MRRTRKSLPHRWRLPGALAVASAMLACEPASQEPPVAAAPPPPVVVETEYPASATDADAVRALARSLAGLRLGEAGSDRVAEPWAAHSEQLSATWGELESRHLGKMREWAAAELPLADPEAALFYPFGGPDLPSALQFFPQARTVVLIGLEPVGRIPELGTVVGEAPSGEAPSGESQSGESLSDEALAGELARLRNGLENLVEAGYFVTKKMERDWAAAHLEGTLPVLLMLLPRLGWAPRSVELVALESDGAVAPLEVATASTGKAVRIEAEAEGQSRTLFYFSQDLSDEGLAAAPAFEAFLGGLGRFNVFMKSASYLLHMENFGALKALLLEGAGSILQDDSGVPFRDLKAAPGWSYSLFGNYTDTLPTYREWAQDDLRTAYATTETEALPFAIAYNSRIGGSCFLWAQRQAP